MTHRHKNHTNGGSHMLHHIIYITLMHNLHSIHCQLSNASLSKSLCNWIYGADVSVYQCHQLRRLIEVSVALFMKTECLFRYDTVSISRYLPQRLNSSWNMTKMTDKYLTMKTEESWETPRQMVKRLQINTAPYPSRYQSSIKQYVVHCKVRT
jgi:hypothetical protein